MNTTQHMDPLTKKVFERINNEHVTPRPRWEFLAKNYTLWGLGALAVVLGALAFAATLFEIQNVDWRLSSATHPDFFSFFLAAAPIIWVVALALFILAGYVNVRKTTHGYRYSFAMIAVGAVLLSLATGSVLFAMGFGGTLDDVVGEQASLYRPTLQAQRSWWVAPEKGVLAGNVLTVASSTASFTLQDFNGHDWKVDSDDLRVRDITVVAHGGAVRVVGVPSTATSTAFHACFVFPWSTRSRGLSTSKRNSIERSNECKGIRPYADLHAIEDSF